MAVQLEDIPQSSVNQQQQPELLTRMSASNQVNHHPSSRKRRNCCSVCCGAICRQLDICCQPCLTESHPMPAEATCGQRFKHAWLCPPHGKLGLILTAVLALLIVWGILWSITADAALPGGSFFGILVLLVLCIIGGQLISFIKLPPLLGELGQMKN